MSTLNIDFLIVCDSHVPELTLPLPLCTRLHCLPGENRYSIRTNNRCDVTEESILVTNRYLNSYNALLITNRYVMPLFLSFIITHQPLCVCPDK